MKIFFVLLLVVLWCFGFSYQFVEGQRTSKITSIIDNGQASHQELKQTKSNADVYNYPALSTSY